MVVNQQQRKASQFMGLPKLFQCNIQSFGTMAVQNNRIKLEKPYGCGSKRRCVVPADHLAAPHECLAFCLQA
jgi:hypothetical protein